MGSQSCHGWRLLSAFLPGEACVSIQFSPDEHGSTPLHTYLLSSSGAQSYAHIDGAEMGKPRGTKGAVRASARDTKTRLQRQELRFLWN